MLPGKGHRELLLAFEQLCGELPFEVELDVAGAFLDDGDVFTAELRRAEGVRFHGQVGPDQRRELFLRAHIFCLPTYYAYEGQPFSIVEAYASGCAVITCLHSGIPDIFADHVNGLAVEQRDVASLKAALRTFLADPARTAAVAATNRSSASQLYTKERFQDQMYRILTDAGGAA